ncbi:DEP domain-containing mTOR-interacting protein-like isoform X2 [Pseudophryne corroboree]|uniref:DEP domain-containing mTOR-interacting protein-like isoform X2 n=1 Tax=Pseudophryne corroboree TaxID=495146 RepID=UPI0030813F8A
MSLFRALPQVPGCEDRGEQLLQKRTEDYQRQAEISLAGEQLRLRLHNAKLIKDRCHHTFTYPNCFVAKELVDWLIEHKEASERETAVSIMQTFFECSVIHHVCDEHAVFKDAKLFYRFRNDDGTLFPSRQMKIVIRSKRLYEMMISQEDPILQLREQGSERYLRTFRGSEMLDWLVKHGQVAKREDGERLCKAMLEYGIIQHVTGRHYFSDSDLLFQFCINFRRRRKLIEVLNDSSPSMDHTRESPDSPFCLRKLSSELPQGRFVCANELRFQHPPLSKRSSNFCIGTGASYCYPPLKPVMSPPSVLKKPVMIDELLAPDSPYILKTLTVSREGFVSRRS